MLRFLKGNEMIHEIQAPVMDFGTKGALGKKSGSHTVLQLLARSAYRTVESTSLGLSPPVHLCSVTTTVLLLPLGATEKWLRKLQRLRHVRQHSVHRRMDPTGV